MNNERVEKIVLGLRKEKRMERKEEVVVGVPVYENEYQRGMIPPYAVVGDPKGIPIHQTIYRDTPAPFNCPYCGATALTTVRYAILFSSISDQIKSVLYYPIKLQFHETISPSSPRLASTLLRSC